MAGGRTPARPDPSCWPATRPLVGITIAEAQDLYRVARLRPMDGDRTKPGTLVSKALLQRRFLYRKMRYVAQLFGLMSGAYLPRTPRKYYLALKGRWHRFVTAVLRDGPTMGAAWHLDQMLLYVADHVDVDSKLVARVRSRWGLKPLRGKNVSKPAPKAGAEKQKGKK